MKASYKKYTLDLKRPSGTSRGMLTQKETYFIILHDNGKRGIGECGLFKGLSVDDVPEYESRLHWVCKNIAKGEEALLGALQNFPSIQFGIEQAFLSVQAVTPFELFVSGFTEREIPISINGLIWMGDADFMHEQIRQKIHEGFSCIKMKIGAIDFDAEIEILRSIRDSYSKEQIELRVDANGAFAKEEVLDKLAILASFDLHSIEQPIKKGDWSTMQKLCRTTSLPIALDEELIGVLDVTEKEKLLQTIQPQFIILKPSLIGGLAGSNEWIKLAKKYGTAWWVTSALESNIGLNAIAQWTATLENNMPQGLGTGGLFTNNFDCPLEVNEGKLYYKQAKNWPNNLISNLCI